MREPRIIEGARAPLFDRLSAKESGQRLNAASLRIIDLRELANSVYEELHRLLNTRNLHVENRSEGAAGTVLDYGIPDFLWASPASDADHQRIARAIERKIAAHEPRLANVRVAVTNSAVPQVVSLLVTATLRIGSVYEPVTFPLTMGGHGVKVE